MDVPGSGAQHCCAELSRMVTLTARRARKCSIATSPWGNENRFWRVHSRVCLGDETVWTGGIMTRDWSGTVWTGHSALVLTGVLTARKVRGCASIFIKQQTFTAHPLWPGVGQTLGTWTRTQPLSELWVSPSNHNPVLNGQGPESLGRGGGGEGF